MESVDVALAVAVAVAVRESSTVGAALTDGDADILTLPLRDGLDDRARDDDTLPVGVAALVTLTGGDADMAALGRSDSDTGVVAVTVLATLPDAPADEDKAALDSREAEMGAEMVAVGNAVYTYVELSNDTLPDTEALAD